MRRATAGASGEPGWLSDGASLAQLVASRLVERFRERLLTAEGDRDAADDARASAEQARHDAEERRARAQRRVIEVERLRVASEELAGQLQQARDARIVIEQAESFIAARYGATPDAAFEAMRRYARSNRASSRDVAADAMTGTPQLELCQQRSRRQRAWWLRLAAARHRRDRTTVPDAVRSRDPRGHRNRNRAG